MCIFVSMRVLCCCCCWLLNDCGVHPFRVPLCAQQSQIWTGSRRISKCRNVGRAWPQRILAGAFPSSGRARLTNGYASTRTRIVHRAFLHSLLTALQNNLLYYTCIIFDQIPPLLCFPFHCNCIQQHYDSGPFASKRPWDIWFVAMIVSSPNLPRLLHSYLPWSCPISPNLLLDILLAFPYIFTYLII